MDGDFINAKNKLIYITFSNVFHMAPTAFEGRRPEYFHFLSEKSYFDLIGKDPVVPERANYTLVMKF